MKKLWKYLENKNWSPERKYQVCLWILSLLGALCGGLVWLALRPVALTTSDWGIAFMGTPVLLTPIAVFLYGCRHPFH